MFTIGVEGGGDGTSGVDTAVALDRIDADQIEGDAPRRRLLHPARSPSPDGASRGMAVRTGGETGQSVRFGEETPHQTGLHLA